MCYVTNDIKWSKGVNAFQLQLWYESFYSLWEFLTVFLFGIFWVTIQKFFRSFVFKRIKPLVYLIYGCIQMLMYICFTFINAKRAWDKTESTIVTTKHRICTYWWYCREIYLINIDSTFLTLATKDSLRSYGKHVSLSVMKRP